jgi:RNA polymerase sigma factor (sigma-70 family)
MEGEPTSSGGIPPDHHDPAGWQRLVEALHPAAMLLRVESRMSSALKKQISPEDIWQETLLCAWRDRAQLEWRGLPAFRQWLMEIAENRIRDAAERFSAAKRNAVREQPLGFGVDPSNQESANPAFELPARGKTPPSVAVHVEQAQVMREALQALPEIYREVLRLRLFEEWERERIALHLGLSIPAVKHRIRLGAALYREQLALVMSSRRSIAPGAHGPEPRRDR